MFSGVEQWPQRSHDFLTIKLTTPASEWTQAERLTSSGFMDVAMLYYLFKTLFWNMYILVLKQNFKCVCECVCVQPHCCVKVRGQLTRIGFLFLQCGSWGFKSGMLANKHLYWALSLAQQLWFQQMDTYRVLHSGCDVRSFLAWVTHWILGDLQENPKREWADSTALHSS